MNIVSLLQNAVSQAVEQLYGEKADTAKISVSPTPGDFTGDYTVVVFSFVKLSKKSPELTGTELGEFLTREVAEVSDFNVIKGFLNLELSAAYWQKFLGDALANPDFGRQPRSGHKVMVEYSSPNTNKPLHLGHVRNILLGWSCSRILEAAGHDVVRVQVINDRGVAICKSMYSWLHFGEGKTPDNSGVKGDHLVGDFYVLFEQKSKEEYAAWQQTAEAQAILESRKKPNQTDKEFFKDFKNQWFNTYSRLGADVREMLRKWEAGDPETVALWQQMNNWVYAGFDQTYDALGVSFDKLYYESNTYLLGKEIVDEGLSKGVFYRKDDGSVWVDLTDIGQDHKLVLRSDGTSVYITQDLGTARMRYQEFGCDRVVYVVADEQNYHFTVLFEVLKRLGEPYADGLFHLSYGLVELPAGRMKTSEGTVVDADELIDEVITLSRQQASERGDVSNFPAEEQDKLYAQIGLGALKFFMIKVNPKKKMTFNPEESVDLQGQTGPYIQYSYVRINGLMQRIEKEQIDLSSWVEYADYQPQEKELLKILHEYPGVVAQAAADYDPSHIANFCYSLAKSYHRFWHDLSIFNADTPQTRAFRLSLSRMTGQVLKTAMGLLGIEMPNRM